MCLVARLAETRQHLTAREIKAAISAAAGPSRELPSLAQAQLAADALSPPPPAAVIVSPTVLETSESDVRNGRTVSFTVQLQSQPFSDVTINVHSVQPFETRIVSPAPATPATLTFTNSNWRRPQTVVIQGVNDSRADGPQMFTIQTSAPMSADPRYNAIPVADVTGVNLDNEPTISIGDVTAAEGNGSGQRIFSFPISIEGNLEGDMLIEYRVANFPIGPAPNDARATPFVDFQPRQSAFLSVPQTARSASIDVVVLSDNQFEPNEVFFVHLFIPISEGAFVGAHIRDNQGIGTILNDDTQPPPAGPGQIVVTVVGNGFVTDSLGRIDTRVGDNVGTYGPSEFPFLNANGFFIEWIGTDCFTNSCPIVPNEFADGLDVTAVFASSLMAGAVASEAASEECGCGSQAQEELDRIASAAIARWAAAGLEQSELERLAGLEIRFEDLAGELLARSALGVIAVDRNAAGHGWFFDPTPLADEEFASDKRGLHAVKVAAEGRIDLLTSLAHEMGHALGLDHGDAENTSEDLMSDMLEPGTRNLPLPRHVDLLFAQGEPLNACGCRSF